MGRIVFKKGKQKTFLEEAYRKSNLDWSGIANVCNVCDRTIRDWRREKYNMSYEAAKNLSKKISINLDKKPQVLPDHWNLKNIAPQGAKRRYEIYGNPGTAEGRKKGGISSHKTKPRSKTIKIPRISVDLAELIGILLGDGGITNYQITISFNREADSEHAIFIQRLIKKLFGVSSSIISYSKFDKADKIVIYSKTLVMFLVNKGLKIGDKLYNRIDIPEWVSAKKKYRIACLRGLIDTDGSFYAYKHKVDGKAYNNFAMCFTSHSSHILRSVYNICVELKFRPSLSNNHVYLHRTKDINRYFRIVASSNIKHIRKYQNYTSES